MDVDSGDHEQAGEIELSFNTHTTAAGWCENFNKKGSAYGSRTIPRSLLGFIFARMDGRFNRATLTNNSEILWCAFVLFFFLFEPSRLLMSSLL